MAGCRQGCEPELTRGGRGSREASKQGEGRLKAVNGLRVGEIETGQKARKERGGAGGWVRIGE